jgi:hypothetical protein
MKIFFYKSLLVFFLFILGFHLTVNYVARSVKNEIENNFSKERVEILKLKIKQEFLDDVDEKVFINPEDAELIQSFINKIKTDLEKNNK